MNSLRRNKNKFYLCKRYIDENNITKYHYPIEVKLNYAPMNSDAQVLALGIDYSKYLIVVGTAKELSIFSNKDRCYIYNKPDLKNFDEMCYDADYEVSGDTSITWNEGMATLKKLSGEYEL